ncbi:MAG: undecaprenyl-diphosphate phosphatase [Candidatus Andersenbacteria bacterium]|nr:undecaprenyl-diphosphate phosphatase [Candidatus Andersenbacteria bacterium]
MEIIQSIILGIIQGVAEFLPISSSGHLVLIPHIFGWQDQGLAFDVALHWGTLFAVLLYFWKDWAEIFRKSYLLSKFKSIKRNRWFHSPDRAVEPIAQDGSTVLSPRWSQRVNIQYLKKDILFIIIVATIPGIIAGLLLNNYAETVFRDPLIVAGALFVGAILLFYSDKIGAKKSGLTNLSLKMGILIGLFQALAIIPGVSRSGITITIALLLGMQRISAARFSFLLSTPIILGAGIMEFPSLIESGLNINILVGVLVSAISGYLAIKYMLKYLENRSYNIFVGYRIVLAILIIILFIDKI